MMLLHVNQKADYDDDMVSRKKRVNFHSLKYHVYLLNLVLLQEVST